VVQGLGAWGGGFGVLDLEKFNISVPFLPTFPFVPLLPVPFLHAPALLKIIVGFKKQTLPTHN